MKIFWLFTCFVIVSCLMGCSTRVLYCHRIGGDWENSFICGDKNETYMITLDLSRLRGRKVPDDWTRVRIVMFPHHPILGLTVPPFFGYYMKNISDQYNDGTKWGS